MNEYKILLTGPMGAGKTTAIASISDSPPVITDVVNTDASNLKTHTTVGLDFGTLTLDTGDRVRFFGTPGQARFNFLWTILAKNSIGIIILTNNASAQPLQDLQIYLDAFEQELKAVACVVGVGRTEQVSTPSLDDYSDAIASKGLIIPVVAVDVRQRADMQLLLDILLTQIEACNITDAQ